MPTVIDSLVVELGLDPRKFTQGQKDALESLRKFQRETERGGAAVEAIGKKTGAFFQRLKLEALGFLGALMGAKGIKDFVQYVTSLDASAGRAAKTLNMTTRDLSAWQGVARQTGGTTEDMTGALQGMSGEMNKVLLGIPTNILPVLNFLHVGLFRANGDLKTAGELFFDLSRAVEGMDPAKARVALGSIGIPESVINTLILGPKKLRELYDEQAKIGVITKEDADAAIGLQDAWNKASTAATGFGRSIVTALTPALKGALDWMSELFGIMGEKDAGEKRRRSRALFGVEGGGGAPIPVKPGAGAASPRTTAVMNALAGMEGIDRVTALNDPYHAFLGGLHPLGRAVDLTVKDPAQAAAMADAIRARLAAAGITATVLDEYNHPSARSTGGHIHVGIGGGGIPPGGFGAPAAAGARSTVSNRGGDNNSVSVNAVNVMVPGGDAASIARSIEPELRRMRLVGPANWGQQ